MKPLDLPTIADYCGMRQDEVLLLVCGRCGFPAPVVMGLIACRCLPGLSAAERFARDARRALGERQKQKRRAA